MSVCDWGTETTMRRIRKRRRGLHVERLVVLACIWGEREACKHLDKVEVSSLFLLRLTMVRLMRIRISANQCVLPSIESIRLN